MKKTNETEIIEIVNKIKNISHKSMKKGKYGDVLKKIKIVTSIEQMFSYQFVDLEIEQMLVEVSDKLLPFKKKFLPVKNRFVFCDSFAWDNHCLSQQYLNAMMSMNVNILYIIDDFISSHSQTLINELKLYDKATIFIVPKDIGLDMQVKLIYNQITNFQPEKIFLQTLSILFIVALNSIEYIPRYRINLADHLFWVGIDCVDYLIEFRNFGLTLSHQKRKYEYNKILLLPFYPIIDDKTEFRGFPKEARNKIILYSGGAVYKICDKNNIFFEIMKRLLLENPSIIILFSARGDDTILKNYIKLNSLENRLILLGYRYDINEVFNNCDIYLQTFPLIGGLMTQYAAYNGKPILSYSTYERVEINTILEDISFDKLSDSYKIIYTELEDFFAEARKLILNEKYRISIGENLKKSVISPEQFNNEFRQLITTNKNIRKTKEVFIDYVKMKKSSFESQESSYDGFILFVMKSFRFTSIIFFPRMILRFLPIFITKYNKIIINQVNKHLKM